MTRRMSTLLLALGLSAGSVQASDNWHTYTVSITNTSLHHIMAPPLVVTHKRDYATFRVGTEASAGLEHQAENGDPSLLKSEADDNPMVFSSTVGDAVLPGMTVQVKIAAPRHARISITSMLAATNDAVVTLNGAALPKHSSHHMTQVIDAGTEMNSENCLDIPGPPCDNGSNENPENGEGKVSFHTGIHGVGNLTPSDLDWRGPVALVSIKRTRD